MEPEDYNKIYIQCALYQTSFNLYLSEIMANLISFFKVDKTILRIEF